MSVGPGQVVSDTEGRSYVVGQKLAEGGQGEIFETRAVTSGDSPILKVPHPNLVSRELERRVDALVAADLSSLSPALCAPFAKLSRTYGLGAFQPRAEGVPLEDLFASSTPELMPALGIGIALCRALTVLERSGFSHGDLSATNVLAKDMGSYFEATVIDLDNFACAGAPAPTFRGQDLYAAPELLAGSATASILSDRFSLAVLLSELLYGRHPFAAAAQSNLSFDQYVELLQQANWDSAARNARGPLPGRPVEVLPRDLHALFRAALHVNAATRPSAATWGRALQAALDELFECEGCHEVFVNEPSRYTCVHCGAAASTLELRVGKRVLPLTAMSTAIGRDDVGGDPSVSREHAVFRRAGFALRVRCRSRNGLAVRVAGTWRELAEGDEVAATDGDRIVFAPGVEGRLAQRRST